MEGREPVDYLPRDHEGDVRSIKVNWKYPENAVSDAEQYLERGLSVMFLGLLLLHAPTTDTHPAGDWNTLPQPISKAQRRVEPAAATLGTDHHRRPDTRIPADDPGRTVDRRGREPLDGNGEGQGNPEREGKEDRQELVDGEEGMLEWDAIHAVFTEEAVEAGLMGNLGWFEQQLTSAKKTAAKFPLAIIKNRGPECLNETPRTFVGTVHSVKGAEADVVYLFPDISRAGMVEWQGSMEQKASVYRLFYVAMTRAKDTLVLAEPFGQLAVNLDT